MTTNGLSELEELLIPIPAGEHIGAVVAKLLAERNEALALAKGFAEALELIKNGGVPQGVLANVAERMLAMCSVAEKALSASPTSLLERFKADERIIEEAKTVASDFKDSSHWVALRDALEAREKLK